MPNLFTKLMQPTVLQLPGNRHLYLDRRPIIMAIVNVTPDSFATEPLYPDNHPEAAIRACHQAMADGADILDIGAESTRPGSQPVDAHEQIVRLQPVVEACLEAGYVLSIDTKTPAVAKTMLELGCHIVNDVSAARDTELLRVAGEYQAGYVLMHARATPEDMQHPEHTRYGDVVSEVRDFFTQLTIELAQAGLRREQIILDPGIGFAKTPAQSLQLLQATDQFVALNLPVLIGASRKSFIPASTGVEASTDQRLGGSLATTMATALAGAHIHRVHDVAETKQALQIALGIRDGHAAAWDAVVA